MSDLHPFLKLPGSKRGLVDQILPLIPIFKSYTETFVGGGSIALALRNEGRLQCPVRLSDASLFVIAAWHGLHLPGPTLKRLQEHIRRHAKDPEGSYRFARNQWNASLNYGAVDRAALALYLSRASFNGVIRENKAGEFNVPPGDKTDLSFDDNNYLATAEWVGSAKVKIVLSDFEEQIDLLGEGDFAVCDPPYDGSFSDYTAAGFNDGDQRRLRDCLKRLLKRGGRFLAFNADTERVRILYRGLQFHEITQKVSVNSDGKGRGKIRDLAICGGYKL